MTGKPNKTPSKRQLGFLTGQIEAPDDFDRLAEDRIEALFTSSAERVTMADPPDGYLFGFPKVFDGDADQHLDDWLRQNGYPEEFIRRFPNGVPCRVYSREMSNPSGGLDVSGE